METLEKRIIGIDPGLGRTGVGIIDGNRAGQARLVWAATLETDKNCLPSKRMAQLFDQLEPILATYKPQEAGVEYLFFPPHASTTVIEVVQARGVILLALERAGVALAEYSPRQIKLALVGSGGASKRQMITTVCQRLNLEKLPGPDDTADGLAAALLHLSRSRFGYMQRLTGRRGEQQMSPALALAVSAARGGNK